MSRRQSLAPTSRAKQQAIVAALRDQVVRGRLAPGQRVPARAKLQRRFHVSGLTVQRALSTLKRDGFLFCRGRYGTFVNPQPPHLHRYGLVFPGNEQAPMWEWSQYWTAILQSAAALERVSPHRFVVYRDVKGFASCEGLQHLLADMNHQRLAGVFIPNNYEVAGMIADQGDPPVPVITSTNLPPGISPSASGDSSFLHRALRHVADAGRKRVAALMLASNPVDLFVREHFGLRRLGLTTRPSWIHGLNPYGPEWVGHAVRAILDGPTDNRPDALVIADDHLVAPAVEELLALGVDVPRDLLVVAYWNFPLPYAQPLPIRRLGRDTLSQLRDVVAQIDAMRRGHEPLPSAPLPAVFEDEGPHAPDTVYSPSDESAMSPLVPIHGEIA